MITHILYQLMGKFSIAGEGFRKILACFISLMLFGLMFAVVRFTGMQIPNFNRNLIMLTAIDLGGFWFLMWKNQVPEVKEEPVEQPQQEYQHQVEPEPELATEPEKIEEVVEEPVKELDNENEDVEKLMNEIIEENKERKEQIEKEMAEN